MNHQIVVIDESPMIHIDRVPMTNTLLSIDIIQLIVHKPYECSYLVLFGLRIRIKTLRMLEPVRASSASLSSGRTFIYEVLRDIIYPLLSFSISFYLFRLFAFCFFPAVSGRAWLSALHCCT